MKIKIYYTKKPDIRKIEEALRKNFSVGIEDAGFLELREEAFNKFRRQYNAIQLIPSIPRFSLWIVDKDIYVEKMNFVFGITMHGRAIVSSFRVGEKLIPKEVVHEIGHIFGLSHCKNYCVMQFSNSIIEAIAKPDMLCNECKRKFKRLHQNLF